MRVSVRPNDPGYDICSHKYKILFDGKEITNCITADEERGLVVCYIEDENGNFKFKNDSFLTVEKHGKVEILNV